MDVIEAIHADRLAEHPGPTARAACTAIGRRLAESVEEARSALSASGITVEVVGTPGAPTQRHAAEFRIRRGDVDGLASALAPLGYDAWHPVTGAGARLHRNLHGVATFARTDDVTTALRFRWEPGRFERVPRALRPNAADLDVVDLPSPLWPLYLAVRPVRLIAERLGVRSRAIASLGPFLATPTAVLEPLLDGLALGPDDVLVDLGCGDGRIAIRAAARSGARAIGVEADPDLVERARRNVTEAGLDDRVDIVQGDAADAPEGTVVIVFLPVDAAGPLVSRLLRSTAPGTRIVAHEQQRFVGAPTPDRSEAIVTDDGVTVVHHWITP